MLLFVLMQIIHQITNPHLIGVMCCSLARLQLFPHVVAIVASRDCKKFCSVAIFCTSSVFSCFLPPALQVPLPGVRKKSCVFHEKKLGKILSVRRIVVPLHSLSEKIRGQGLEKRFPGPHEEAVFDILQTATRQQSPVPLGEPG